MAFFTVVPEDYPRGITPPQRQSKRAIMHVDQVVIQADRMVPTNRNSPEMGRIRYHEPLGSMYSNDTYYGPPERKKMRRDYSIVSAQPSDDYGSERFPKYYDSFDNAHPCDRRDPLFHHCPKQRHRPASSWESSDSSYSSITQSTADYEIIEEERQWANNYREDGNRRGTYGPRNQRASQKHNTNVSSSPLYDMGSVCSKCCKPQNEQKPVEVQIQECPGLPEMRAYVVVPLNRSATQNRGELDQVARRAARAVPPIMRASRRPQAVVVECNRNKDMLPVSTSNRTSTTTATAVPVTSVPTSHPSTAPKSRSRDPTPVSSLTPSGRQEPVDGLANAAVAAVAAASKPTTPATSAGVHGACKGQCTIASYEAHGKRTGQKINTIGSSRFTFLHTPSEESPGDESLNFDSVASSLASMDCCTFISKLPNVLLMMDKASKRFRVPRCFGNVTKKELQP